jgi:hypothetical protein
MKAQCCFLPTIAGKTICLKHPMKKTLLAQLMFGWATKRNPAVRGGQRQLRPLRFQNLGGFHAPATRDGCDFSGSVVKMMIDALERPSNWSWIGNDPNPSPFI